jgi:YVTN family beta-propeller protein
VSAAQRRRQRGVSLAGLVLALVACTAGGPAVPEASGGWHASAPLALSRDGRTLWVVNPDADSVTTVDTTTLLAAAPVPVGREPWAVAVTGDGLTVVLNRGDGTLTLLRGPTRHDVAVGPEPGGFALDATGRYAFVSVSSAAHVAVVDLVARSVLARVPVGRAPWGVAARGAGPLATLVVVHRFGRPRFEGAHAHDDGLEGWLSVVEGGALRELVIEPYAFGSPNLLEGVALHADAAYVVHLLASPEAPRTFDTTVSGGLSRVPLGVAADEGIAARASSDEGGAPRIHLNADDFSTPTNFPRAVALSPDGATAYVALAGTDAVMGIDLAAAQPTLLGFWPTGANPRGIVVDRDGRCAYVLNHLSRDVSVLDLEDVKARRALARVSVAPETLTPALLSGKRLFNAAFDPRLSHLGWISCATCHPDGGVDGVTWDTPEGRRQTTPLWRLEGTAPFHASATRDEVQDFEVEIEGFMGGSGLAPGRVAPLLGSPNGGRSFDLDALAAYVLQGIRTPSAGTGGLDAAAGRDVFAAAGCASCHGGPAWTRSALHGTVGTLAPSGEGEVLAALRDVGTYGGAPGLGANGFDVPTLLGLHATAPYLHDGSVPTLLALVSASAHAPAGLDAGQRAALAAFLASIDDATPPFE